VTYLDRLVRIEAAVEQAAQCLRLVAFHGGFQHALAFQFLL